MARSCADLVVVDVAAPLETDEELVFDTDAPRRNAAALVSLESADVVLVKDELAQIPYLLCLSEKTMQIAKQNIVASLVIKLVLGALGVAGVTGLLATVVAGDDGVTMLLLLNTLRLERVK